jgi:hypothetical protein
MSNCDVTVEELEIILGERLVHQTDSGTNRKVIAVGRRNAGALLTAMLERIEPEERQPRDVFSRREYAENTAFFVQFVIDG